MFLGRFMGLFGWLAVWGIALTALNFLVKWLNKHYVVKLPQSKEQIKQWYKVIMKNVIRYHKPLGLIAAVAMLVHMGINISYGNISVTGLGAGILLIWVAAWGLYGSTVKKKGKWLFIHRTSVVLLLLAVAVHVL